MKEDLKAHTSGLAQMHSDCNKRSFSQAPLILFHFKHQQPRVRQEELHSLSSEIQRGNQLRPLFDPQMLIYDKTHNYFFISLSTWFVFQM